MRELLKRWYNKLSPVLKWINPFFDLKKCILASVRYVDFFRDLKTYKKCPGLKLYP